MPAPEDKFGPQVRWTGKPLIWPCIKCPRHFHTRDALLAHAQETGHDQEFYSP